MADQEAKIDLGITGLGPAEHIGRGGFADVYKAEQLSLRRTVAVKVLRAQASDIETEARFERECHAIGAVSDHPHIVGVHEGGFTRNGRAYLVMEYLPGGSLLDRLADHGPMQVSQIVDTGIKIARALAVAHQAGVLHRDVKPANIMISAYGEPALGDFGIARIEGGHQTATGLVTASFAHAAPEVLEGMAPTASADIYSLGSTMFELMTGQAPYYSATDESIWPLMKRILSEPMPSPESIGMSKQLGRVFSAATSRDPAGRYDNADHMAEDLLAVASDPLALTRYPAVGYTPGDIDLGGDFGLTSETKTAADDGPSERPSALIAGAQLGIGAPPATKPDLMSLRRADTDVLPTTAANPTGRFSPTQPSAFSGGQEAVPVAKARGGGSGRLLLGLAGLGIVAAIVAGGAIWWLGRDATGSDFEATSEIGLSFDDAESGPLGAGQTYELRVPDAPSGAQLTLLLDGEPVGEGADTLASFEAPEGRHWVAVQIATDTGPETTAAVDFYATSESITTGYSANLDSIDSESDGWQQALSRYDRLAAAGHEDLQLLASEQIQNLGGGRWAIFVPGFGDGEQGAKLAEDYCQRFDLPVPEYCHASYHQPSS